jgi:hypothetical protein
MVKRTQADQLYYQPLLEVETSLPVQRAETMSKQVYAEAFLLEWILISNYSAGDFGHRFLWPEIGPEIQSYFSSQAALGAV